MQGGVQGLARATLRCPARGLRGRGWQPRAVRLPRARPACTSRSQSDVSVLGFWRAAHARPTREARCRGCSERSRACAPYPARDHRVRGRHPCPPCSSRPLAACTSGTCRGSGAPQGVRVRRTARHGAARPPRGRSTCAPGRGGGLYVLPRPTQSRPARSARAWWACSGAPLGPRGWYPADSWNRPGVVGAEALRRAWVVLLRA